MGKLSQRWFTPAHQPNPDAPVEFELRPLDQATLYTLQASFNERGAPSWEGVKACFENAVVGWKGVTDADGQPLQFSRRAAGQILRQEGTGAWTVWLSEIAGSLYAAAVLADAEKKT